MDQLLKRLKKVQEAKIKADAQLQVAEERLDGLKNKLSELGIEAEVDVEALKVKIADETKKVVLQLDEAEEILSEIDTGRQ